MSGKTSYQSTKKYQDKTYDRIGILVPKGSKAEIKKYADKLNMSVNAFIKAAIKEKMERAQEAEEHDE